MRLEIVGKLVNIEDVQEKGDLRFQYILIEKKVHNQDDGELVRTDNFPATLFNKKIDEIDVDQYHGKKVKCTCYLNSQESKTDDRVFHNLRLKVFSMEEFVPPSDK